MLWSVQIWLRKKTKKKSCSAVYYCLLYTWFTFTVNIPHPNVIHTPSPVCDLSKAGKGCMNNLPCLFWFMRLLSIEFKSYEWMRHQSGLSAYTHTSLFMFFCLWALLRGELEVWWIQSLFTKMKLCSSVHTAETRW